jgi:hypothetical protein
MDISGGKWLGCAGCPLLLVANACTAVHDWANTSASGCAFARQLQLAYTCSNFMKTFSVIMCMDSIKGLLLLQGIPRIGHGLRAPPPQSKDKGLAQQACSMYGTKFTSATKPPCHGALAQYRCRAAAKFTVHKPPGYRHPSCCKDHPLISPRAMACRQCRDLSLA